METTTMYLRVDQKLKNFFVAEAKKVDRPMNYHVIELLTKEMTAKSKRRTLKVAPKVEAKKVEVKKVVSNPKKVEVKKVVAKRKTK